MLTLERPVQTLGLTMEKLTSRSGEEERELLLDDEAADAADALKEADVRAMVARSTEKKAKKRTDCQPCSFKRCGFEWSREELRRKTYVS